MGRHDVIVDIVLVFVGPLCNEFGLLLLLNGCLSLKVSLSLIISGRFCAEGFQLLVFFCLPFDEVGSLLFLLGLLLFLDRFRF